MPGRPGQPLTRKEVEEIEAYNAAGVARPSKYDDAVFDSSAPGGATYRWATAEEKRRATEDAREAAKAAADRERTMTRVRDIAAGRAVSEDESQEEGSPFGVGDQVPTGDQVPAPEGLVRVEARGPEPMPASLANALRGARPVNRNAKATPKAEDTAPAESASVPDAKPADEARD